MREDIVGIMISNAKKSANLFLSDFDIYKRNSELRIIKTQKLCDRKAISVIANHALRQRPNSSVNNIEPNAFFAKKNTNVAIKRMTINALMCSGMGYFLN